MDIKSEETEMKIRALIVDPNSGSPVLVLKDNNSENMVPIWVGACEANAIASAIENLAAPRPMTHDLLRNLITQMSYQVLRILITELKENTYYSVIEMSNAEGDTVYLDARPSDAIALALRCACPIFVKDIILQQQHSEKDQANQSKRGDQSRVIIKSGYERAEQKREDGNESREKAREQRSRVDIGATESGLLNQPRAHRKCGEQAQIRSEGFSEGQHPERGGQQLRRLRLVRGEHEEAGELRVAPLQHADAAGRGRFAGGGRGRLLRLEHDGAGRHGLRRRQRLTRHSRREGEQGGEREQVAHGLPSTTDWFGYRTKRPAV